MQGEILVAQYTLINCKKHDDIRKDWEYFQLKKNWIWHQNWKTKIERPKCKIGSRIKKLPKKSW